MIKLMKKHFTKLLVKRLLFALVICGFVYYCFYPISFDGGEIPDSALEKGGYYFNTAPPLKEPTLSEIPSEETATEMMKNYHSQGLLLKSDRALGHPFIIIVYGDSRYYVADAEIAGETDFKTVIVTKYTGKNGAYERKWASRGTVPADFFEKLTNMYKRPA